MRKPGLRELYNQIFQEVYPTINNQEQGVLYTLIHILYGKETNQADYVCKRVGVNRNNYREDDKKLVDGLINNPKENIFQQLNNVLSDRNKMEIFWLVVIACTLVGVITCTNYLKSTSSRNKQPTQETETVPISQPISPKPKSITAALCLVVPAFATSNLQQSLGSYELEQLIDSASYFLCTTIDDANSKQERLELTNEDIPVTGNRDIYIKIHIPNGQEMIDKKVPYILKRNLPLHGQGTVEFIRCLKNLIGLEVFNRV